MDIGNIIEEADNADCAQALQKLLSRFLDPAFGALPKGEVELLMLNALEDVGAIDPDPEVYELVSKLKVTRSKARNLVYERELRRLGHDDLERRVHELIRSPTIQKAGEQFALEVENPLVSDHIRNKVKKLGFVSDGSFSPSIVKLPLGAFTALIEENLGEEGKNAARQALVEAGAPDTSFKGVVKAVAQKLGTKIASDAGGAVVDEVSEYFGPLIDGRAEDLRGRVQELFRDEGNANG